MAQSGLILVMLLAEVVERGQQYLDLGYSVPSSCPPLSTSASPKSAASSRTSAKSIPTSPQARCSSSSAANATEATPNDRFKPRHMARVAKPLQRPQRLPGGPHHPAHHGRHPRILRELVLAPQSQAASHYGVGPDRIYQFVDEDNGSWADANMASDCSGITIEHQGGIEGVPVTDAEVELSARLCADISRRYRLGRLVHNGLSGNVYLHREIPGTDHFGCPTALSTACPLTASSTAQTNY